MTAAPTPPLDLAVAWLLARAPSGRARIGPGVPPAVAAGLVERGQEVLVDDPDAVRGEAVTPWLVRAPGDGAPDTAVVVLADLPALSGDDGAVPLLTITSLGGDALTSAAIDGLFGPAPWRCVDEHLVAGTGAVWWVASWRPAEPSGELASLLTHRLADAATVLAAGSRTVADEVQRLAEHARNLEQQYTAARQGSQLAERMHARLAREMAAVQRAAQAERSPVDRLKSVARSVRGGGDRAGPAALGPPPALSLSSRLPDRARVGAPFRVGIVGADASTWLGSWVRPVVVEPGWRGELIASSRHLEALVVSEEPAGWSVDDLRAVVDEAHDAGLKVIGVRSRPASTPWFDGLVDVEVVGDPGAAGAGRLAAPRPSDPARANPLGWRRLPGETHVLVTDRPVPDQVLEAARRAVGPGRLGVLGDGPAGDLPRVDEDGDGRLATLRGVRAVVDHPALHPDAGAHAAWLAELSLAAVPVLCLELPETVGALLGDRLTAVLRSVTAADLEDPDERERLTVVARRAAWLAHTTEARWRQLLPRLGLPVPRRRSFSLVLATNRPDFLDHCLAQAAKQRWEHAELVVGLHGTDFPADAEDRIRAGTGLPTTIVHVEDHEPLGEVLNRACQAASGDVVTKWDDDDWYSPDHLVDLAMALDYSGAQLVGKAAEFVYLADLDLTTRRYTTGAETASRTIAGGTMAMAREDLRSIGWWPHVPRTVDQHLIAALIEVGGTVHRTHGFGYILNRHGVGHTWNAAVDYFLRQSESQRRGLDLVFAGVEDASDP